MIIAYVAAAVVGFRLAFVAEQITTVWAPTGIALAALLVGGPRLWPAVWVGAFLANLGTAAPAWTALVIASGNTLEAAVAVAWLRKRPLFDPALRRIADVTAFILIAAAICTAISATLGAGVLCLAGVQPWTRFPILWFDWWLGDALGALVVAPAILTTLAHPWSTNEGLRDAGWVAAAVLITTVVFGQLVGTSAHPIEYGVFPLAIAAAVAGGPRSTSWVVLSASVVAIWYTVKGSGPFASSEAHYSLILLQAFMGVLAGTSLLLAASVAERVTAERREKDAASGLRKAKLAAESANQLKDQFLATLSHELRTPLNAVLGYARLLQTNSIAPEKQAKAIETIVRNARAQHQLVEDLLDMSRITTGKLRLDPAPVPVVTVLREAVEGIKPAADAKRITLAFDFDPLAGSVRADPTRLQQVFWNVLTNAVKFTGEAGTVTIALRRTGSHVEITVSDTGIGISPEFLPFVFEPFRQGDTRFNRAHGGLGLGLAITKQLVELHGGTIRAASGGPGQGATVTITLPGVILPS